MKKSIIRISIIALMALAAMLPQAVAFAGWEDSDNGCPPRSAQGTAHASENALLITAPNNPPAASQAWVAMNPGNKAGLR
ncbi:MAG: hypothetical protein Q7O66_00580 [Dehalococcoidia bacterium]|nr:hypothetical protein [Dehalococcoidia bacterium]